MWSICCSKNDRANYSLSRQTLWSEDLQYCESWRDAELVDRAVCTMNKVFEWDLWWEWELAIECYDWWNTDPKPRSCSTFSLVSIVTRPCNCLTSDTLITFNSSTSWYDCWHQASPTVCRPTYDTSSPCRRFRLLRGSHDASDAQRLLLAAGYVFLGGLLGFILCYRPILPVYLLVFP